MITAAERWVTGAKYSRPRPASAESRNSRSIWFLSSPLFRGTPRISVDYYRLGESGAGAREEREKGREKRIKNRIANRKRLRVQSGEKEEAADRRKHGVALLRWSGKKKRKENG